MKLGETVPFTVLVFLAVTLSKVHGQALPPNGELPIELRARLVPNSSAIDLIVPKSDTAGVVELYGARDLSKLLTQPENLRLTNAPTTAELLWRQPVGEQGFYRAQLRAGVTVADYLPKIIAQPQGTAVEEGATATLAVSSSAFTGQSYQWQFNGNDLPGQTGPTLTLANFTASAQGEYRVIVSSVAGSVSSAAVMLTAQVPIPPAPEGMVWIPPGTFVMGSPVGLLGEYARNPDETQHTVKLEGFFMGRFEVRQSEYKAVMGVNPSYFKGGDLPVEQVAWYDATNYCAKLSARERAAGRLPAGWEYRLPTEAQWEYACRAGTTTATAFGNSLSGAQANFNGKQSYPNRSGNDDPAGIYKRQTTPVGSYAPNAWGLYDMHGNVWEWCADWYGDYSNRSITDPKGPSSGVDRVLRGGGWSSFGEDCRSAYRDKSNAGVTDSHLGFRAVLVRVPFPPPDFVWIQSGTFVMGSPVGEPERKSDETQHTVKLEGFFMGRFEVRQSEYKAVMGVNPSYFKGENLPVERVTWSDAKNYCGRLTAGERAAGRLPAGWEYRLPTEAQWEYACRAGTTTATAFGNSLSGAQANFNGKQSYPNPSGKDDPRGIYREKTTPVGSYAPNAWGLYDMHGNVWEWCADWYGDYSNLPIYSGVSRVSRGGGWIDFGRLCRSAYRNYYPPGISLTGQGFRVVLVRVP